MKNMDFEKNNKPGGEETRPYDYEVNPPQGEDPLVVGTEKYGNYRQDDGMVPDDVLEDQKYGMKPEEFVPIEELPDPDSLGDLESVIIEEDGEDGEDEEKVDENPKEFDPSEVYVNGFRLKDIMEGKVSEEELPQGSGISYGEKVSVNRDRERRDFADEERKEWRKHKNARARFPKQNTLRHPYKHGKDLGDFEKSA